METIKITLVIAVLFYINFGSTLKVKEESFRKNDEKCADMSKNAYFDIDQVVGKPWRVYYTWNVKLESKCLDMTFKNATNMIINRIYHDMYEYLENQPNWDAATLHATIGTANHELLLFADQGPAGVFVGVPNVVRDANVPPPARRGVPTLKFFLKLLHHGKYLLMIDCKIGMTSLSARERPPYRAEIASVANSLRLGVGNPACITDKKPDEQMFI